MNIPTQISEIDARDAYPTRLPGAERMIERQDPVLWSDWTPAAPLSQDAAVHYRDKGYLVAKDLFSEAEIARLIDAGKALRRNAAGIRGEDLVTEPGADEVRTVFRLDEHSALFRRLAHDRRLAGVAEFLLNDRVYLHQSRLNYKPGFTGKEFYWHSDFETWHAEDGMPRMRAVSASVLLTDNSALNGPLMLVPGSHNSFVACAGETPERNHESSLRKQVIGVPQPGTIARLVEKLGLDAATGPAGTVVFFECNTLHGSNGNITPHPRSNAFFVYNALSNRLTAPFAAKAPRPPFLANRGTPEAIEPVAGEITG